jgi:hypothetical protein
MGALKGGKGIGSHAEEIINEIMIFVREGY